MIATTLRELPQVLGDAAFIGAAAALRRRIAGYSTDSRSLKKGEVFVALAGETFNGHDFIDQVAQRGALAAVVARSWFAEQRTESSLPLIVVEDTLVAYGTIAAAHRAAFKIPVIAVAGSNGKTTTKELIANLLGARYNVLRTEGNLNNLIGVPAMLLRLREEHTAAVIEIGTNTPGEIARLCGILQPTHGIITNIGREHLELLGSVEGVAREEGALFEYLNAHGGTAFVNLDDPFLARMGRRLARRITYGMRASAEIGGKIGALNEQGAPLLTVKDRRTANERSFDVQLCTPGRHTAGNALAATAVALALRVTQRDIKRTLGSFESPVYKGGYARLAPMVAADGARLLNDTYNSNPDSTLAALRTLAAMKPRRGGIRIVVLADMKELGRRSREEHRAIGEELGRMKGIGLVLFHGTEMRHAYRALVASGAVMRMKPMHFAEKDALADALLAFTSAEDIVLVKGSRGMKMEDVVARLVRGE